VLLKTGAPGSVKLPGAAVFEAEMPPASRKLSLSWCLDVIVQPVDQTREERARRKARLQRRCLWFDPLGFTSQLSTVVMLKLPPGMMEHRRESLAG
jgi:hypothetical protein